MEKILTEKVIIMEPDNANLEVLRSTLANLGYAVAASADVAHGLKQFEPSWPSLFIIDSALLDKGGLDFISIVTKHYKHNVSFIILVGGHAQPALDKLAGFEIHSYLSRPVKQHELVGLVRLNFDLIRKNLHIEKLQSSLSSNAVSSAGDSHFFAQLSIFQKAIDIIQVGVMIVQPDMSIKYVNNTQAALLRAKRDEITGKYLYDFMPNQYCALSDEKVHRSEQILFRGDGAFIHLQIVSDMVLDDKEQPIAYIYCCMDVSEIKEQEKELINYSEQLEDMVRERTKELEESNRDLAVSLKEKEVLLKEVHHRVRNSLQIITSMVNISVSNVTDPAFLLVLKSSYSRLRAIALLHDSLYESPDMESVGVGDFINILAGELISLYGVPIPNLLVNTNIDTLSINIMMSCGLILNELISNSLRHAFEKTTKGNITISFNLEDNNIYKLTVSDNGRGMDVSRDLTGAYSGILLVKDLVKSKLKGSVEIDGTHGTNITVVFKEVVGKYHNVV